MSFKIRKVAVLGSGVMGSGIAAHCANIGLEVLLLDIIPFDLAKEERKDPAKRNSIVEGALKKAIKQKPAPFYSKSYSSRIQTGNFDDDFEKIRDCDWVIEVVIENLDIKKQIFEKVDKHRRPGSLVTSNTSSIPIHLLSEGRSDDFKVHFCGTHFFNPPRYLKLFEVIPPAETKEEVVQFYMDYGDCYLGKKTVLCKDTPGFIGNRVGFFSGAKMTELTHKYRLKIEEVDSLTGTLLARPKTGHFRLQDLVGLDVSENVMKVIQTSCPDDEYVIKSKDFPKPKYMNYLLENKFLGDKSGQGFYKKTRDEEGKRLILALDLETLEYKPSIKPDLPVMKNKKIEKIEKRLQAIVESEGNGAEFLTEYFGALFAYVSKRIPEISDSIYSIDDAMKAGYAWGYGPFEYWDMLGVDKGIQLAESTGESIADWVKEMVKDGKDAFYQIQGGKKMCYDLSHKIYKILPNQEAFIVLDHNREKSVISKNSEAAIHDIGDGVLCVEFTSKANSIGQGTGLAINEALERAENEDWKGVVIGNDADNFSVGANLMSVGMLAMQKQFDDLDEMVNAFQQLTMRLRYSSVPTVAATQGYVFGGGCEIAMHCDAVVASPESYVGLVEVGVGLLPGGGGCKEMALRASDKFFEGDVQMPTLQEHFRPIVTASVTTSAPEAYEYNLFIPEKDELSINGARRIAEAKKKVLQLADHYTQPLNKEVTVLGRAGLAMLYTAINEFRLGNYMSDYDVEIARKVAYVMCGGDLTYTQKVSQQYLLNLEREAFLSLLGNQKTMNRIQHMLTTNKPLRN